MAPVTQMAEETTNMFPSLHAQHHLEEEREEQDSQAGFETFDEYNEEDNLDSDMEGSIINRPRPKKAPLPPALPQRSEKRASKILDGMMEDLANLANLDKLNGKGETERASLVKESDPHEQYLSSEEDASLSDDYEGSLMEFEESDEEECRGRQTSRPSSRRSQEVTARVVSFIVVGKPQIVTILNVSPTNSHPSSRHSMNLDALTSFKRQQLSSSPPKSRSVSRRPTPLNLDPVRRMSIATSTSYIPANPSARSPMQLQNTSMSNLSIVSTNNSTTSTSHPARKSSRMGLASLTSLVTSHVNSRKASLTSYTNMTPITASSTHTFLNSDPFARNSNRREATNALPPSPTDTPTTPKTPTSIAMLKKGLSRTLSIARKSSMPKLSQAYNGIAASSNLSLASSASSTNTNPPRRASTSHGLVSISSPQANSSRAVSSTLERITSSEELPAPTQPRNITSSQRPSVQLTRSETLPLLSNSNYSSGVPQAPIRYEDVLRAALKGSPAPPLSPLLSNEAKSVKDWRKERRSFGILGRQKSIKA